MPKFNQYVQTPAIKMLYLGHSGAGKTGSLVSLAAAGYRVRIIDLDGKAGIIRDFVTNPKSMYLRQRPGLWTAEQAARTAGNISYVTMTEGYNIQGANAFPKGDSWFKINKMLNDWRDDDDKPGNLSKWGPNDVLVIDSFSRYCEAAMNYQLSLTGHLTSGPQVGSIGNNDYSHAYGYIRNQLQLLKSDEVKCNVILICHIVFMEPPGPQVSVNRQARGFPQVFGRANISPQISQFFGHSVRATSVGNHPSIKRTIYTNNDENVELINPAPFTIKNEYPLETGLAEYFRDYRSGLTQEANPEDTNSNSNVTQLTQRT
jgi:hypothetical protein